MGHWPGTHTKPHTQREVGQSGCLGEGYPHQHALADRMVGNTMADVSPTCSASSSSFDTCRPGPPPIFAADHLGASGERPPHAQDFMLRVSCECRDYRTGRLCSIAYGPDGPARACAMKAISPKKWPRLMSSTCTPPPPRPHPTTANNNSTPPRSALSTASNAMEGERASP
jgi:hypothetical protein